MTARSKTEKTRGTFGPRAAHRRQPTQYRAEPWPFLLTDVPGRGLVKNVPAPQPKKDTKK